MKKITDPIIMGGIAGCFATAIKEIGTRIFVKKGTIPFDGIQKAAGMIIPPYDIRTPKGTAVGILMDMAVGSTFAAGLALLHRKGIIKISPLNGTFFGLSLWAMIYGGLGKISDIQKTTPTGALFTAGWHLIYGAIVGSLISLMGQQHGAGTNMSHLNKGFQRKNGEGNVPQFQPHIPGLR